LERESALPTGAFRIGVFARITQQYFIHPAAAIKDMVR
jgi:hypothetical protein